MTDVSVGTRVAEPATEAGRHPRWMQFVAPIISGRAKLPSGTRGLVTWQQGTCTRSVEEINVLPVSQAQDTSSPWRCIIYAPTGQYMVMNGLTGIPTIGTPEVRLSADGPSRAVINVPIGIGTKNILSPTFRGWTLDHQGPVERGMELTVEYRNTQGTLVPVFRGIIHQIEKGEVIKITAYDRLMDLLTFSDQYQSDQGYVDRATSTAKTEAGTNYVYTMDASVGVVSSCQAQGTATINALSAQTVGDSSRYTGYFMHDLPAAPDGGGVTRGPAQGATIFKVRTRVFVQQTIDSSGTVTARIMLYRVVNGEFIQVATTENKSASGINFNRVIEWDVNWTLEGDPSEYRLAGYWSYSGTSYWRGYGFAHSSTRYTTSAYWTSSNGTDWTSTSATAQRPEISIDFTNLVDVPPAQVSISSTTATIPISSIPDWPSSDGSYISQLSKGDSIILSYFVSNSASLLQITEELIRWAGLVPDLPQQDIGSTSYYSSSTYDYLTCVQEIIRAANYGLKIIPNGDAGKVTVRPRHTIDEQAVAEYSTDPTDAYSHVIVAHDLTAHWMAEKATVAYIAEDVTASGLPVALETDDALQTNPLTVDLMSPLRQVVADKSLGTHALQANAAGGKIVQLHTNVYEGRVTLAGYRPELWDLFGSGTGGKPLSLKVPEAGVDGVAVPTQLVFADGLTEVTLDNIRTADRSEVANSMGLSADAISNSQIPDAVFVFAKVQNLATQDSGIAMPATVDSVRFYHQGQTAPAGEQTNTAYIKVVRDNAGYGHVCAVFPKKTPGWSANDSIVAVSFHGDGGEIYAVLDNPKRVYDGQVLHVDIRWRLA